jgi:hypothetical protein
MSDRHRGHSRVQVLGNTARPAPDAWQPSEYKRLQRPGLRFSPTLANRRSRWRKCPSCGEHHTREGVSRFEIGLAQLDLRTHSK